MLNTLSAEEFQFIKAIDKYKAENGKTFLSWTDVLKVIKDMGYRQVSPPSTKTRAGKEKGKDRSKSTERENKSAKASDTPPDKPSPPSQP